MLLLNVSRLNNGKKAGRVAQIFAKGEANIYGLTISMVETQTELWKSRHLESLFNFRMLVLKTRENICPKRMQIKLKLSDSVFAKTKPNRTTCLFKIAEYNVEV